MTNDYSLKYPATFEPISNGGYVVTFRDIPEVTTHGGTFEEARDMAQAALVTAFDFYFESGRKIPTPDQKGRDDDVLITVPTHIQNMVGKHNILTVLKEHNATPQRDVIIEGLDPFANDLSDAEKMTIWNAVYHNELAFYQVLAAADIRRNENWLGVKIYVVIIDQVKYGYLLYREGAQLIFLKPLTTQHIFNHPQICFQPDVQKYSKFIISYLNEDQFIELGNVETDNYITVKFSSGNIHTTTHPESDEEFYEFQMKAIIKLNSDEIKEYRLIRFVNEFESVDDAVEFINNQID